MSLDRDEFLLAAIGRVEKGIEGIHSRLDALNGRTRASEDRLTRIETWAAAARWAIGGGGLLGLIGAVVGVVQFIAAHRK